MDRMYSNCSSCGIQDARFYKEETTWNCEICGDNMKIVFGTPWIEEEFGQRPEGWKLFINQEQAQRESAHASATGCYDGGYLGPRRPVTIWEIPFDSLPEDLQQKLEQSEQCHSTNNWEPKFALPTK